MKKVIYFILTSFISTTLFAQSGKSLLNDSVLHEIRVEINIPDWFETLESDFKGNLNKPESYPEIYRMCNVTIDGEKLDSVGFREKGNYSNSINNASKKKPFKLSFDEFKDQKYNGLKKINLNNGTDDPSFVREALVFKLMRDEGLPACRTSYAKLYINDEYWGLYILIENVDKTFLKDQYGKANNNGNLYKTDRGAGVSLNWFGNDTTPYINEGLLLKTNEDSSDWSTFFHFVDIVNNTPPAEMKEKLGAVFDVEGYLKYLAVEKLVFSWDSYWGGGNNFYLYEHPDGKIRWLPWDFNETMQDHKLLLKLIISDYKYLIPTNSFDKRPLLKAIFSVPEWKEMYLNTVCQMLSGKFQTEQIAPTIIRWQDLIRNALIEDEKKINSIENFSISLTQKSREQIECPRTGLAFNIDYPGIFPFIAKRRVWAGEELQLHNFNCNFPNNKIDSYTIGIYPNPASNNITIHWETLQLNVSKIIVMNLLGESVIESKWINYTSNAIQMDISSLNPGFYLVKKLDADGQHGICKLIKE